MQSTYGRSRQSIADIEQELYEIFNSHPNSRPNEAGEPVIPADALVDIFRSFSDIYNGVELLTDDETGMLKALLASNPGLEVTPQTLLAFIAEKTKHSPRDSPDGSPQEDDTILPDRGRMLDRDEDNVYSRSSSRDSRSSAGTSVYIDIPSRPPSVPPKTPTSRTGPSPFDTSRRQRSTPLNNAPSSWTKKPAPAHRRKSIDGSAGRASSDSESSFSSSPTTFGRTPGRTRAPSNPTSPSTSFSGAFSPTLGSSPFGHPISRPHSRAQSQPFNSFAQSFGSPDRDLSPDDMSPLRDRDFGNSSYEYDRPEENIMDSISSLPMPRAGSDDDDGDFDGDSSLGLVLDRSVVSSTASLEPQDRLDALQRANLEMGRKLMDAERTLQNKLSEHDSELEEFQGRLEELKSELSATKREEKELRSKERSNSTQIAALESEIAKLQKNLENARSAYQSLQKQYQEQCAESERYRNTLRRRDQEIKDHQEAAALQVLEAHKYAKEHDNYEERIAHLENELEITQQAHAQLDEQKQENLMLKETIDRMRYDMDEMRNSATNATQGGSSAGSSAANSISKSLGAELLGKMGNSRWGLKDEGEETIEEGDSGEVEMDDDDDTEGEEEEDVIQTIITRKKRKVTGRTNKVETTTFEETREYSDAYTQYHSDELTSVREIQTDPEPSIPTASSYTQTDDPPVVIPVSTQTDPEPVIIPKLTASIEIQTDDPEPEVSRSPSPHVTPEDDETMASSSSTVLPPTPKAQSLDHLHPHPHDLPPSYHQVAELDEDERDWRVAAETLKKWHEGVKIPIEPAPKGISDDAVEEWKAIKEELGIDCMVIDRLIASSEKTGQPRLSKDGKPSRKNRFYNIYNTYVYGAGKDRSPSFPGANARQIMLCMGASAFVLYMMAPYMAAQYSITGGPTYYDRSAWNSFNSMQAPGEGFGYDGTAAVWSFMGRVGGGAARIARGWPT
ncbi:hypothetical protein SERLADRAFT_361453 [Serpula lacrymans var. lacrymans S7.9]|uniref:Uncharacterized protein n=1 Tax=Serpula lacrymans var. lacrymans (strain S7.9) TaxID=578457 RepID=F8NWC8_SERL9|nr:uncharacterized protein SERLADRAFT_361453 [Serpula lacrymans var. lacrymans S7.9]EGO24332.1 hypothetical protein SERLADRAFT_361453 [Serpula lacrymans var. lacrymans S7.9]